ncbi:class I SAM-dependent methyltransferase [Allocoleopsis sp.]|uniref:class I SAM-dependent methyltransferase n=1 Tax=Allocoleopsis sp. TaxID=3088169 RepID=UPI002FD1374A
MASSSQNTLQLINYFMSLKDYQLTFKSYIKFEAISLFGRLFLNNPPPIVNPDVKLLNLGCGKTIFEDWVNADFFRIKFWKDSKEIWRQDLRYPLKCPSHYWDGIFTEHVIEHLYPIDGFNLLKEILRTLKPKAWLRITVPDLKKYVDFYSGKNQEKDFCQKWSTGAEAIGSLTQSWGHLSVWDSDLLGRTLQEVGFSNIREVGFSEGTDLRLIKDDPKRQWESLYMEAQKP